MNLAARRLRSIGWIATLMVCTALVVVLAFRVNALRSQVHQSELKIVALKQETMYLETEFETRANQQQLKAWNDVEFGYVAPTAGQYLETERQLAAYAKPVEPGAPAPVRVASNDDALAAEAMFPAMVSPLTGKHEASATDAGPRAGLVPAVALAAAGGAGLAERLALVQPQRDAAPAKPDAEKADKVKADKTDAKPHKLAKTDNKTDKAHADKTHADKAHPAKALAAHDKAHPAKAGKAHPAKALADKGHDKPHAKPGAPIRIALKDVHAKGHGAGPHDTKAAR